MINKETLKKNLVWVVGALMLVLLVSVFVVRPSVIGYSVYKEIKKTDIPKEDFINGIEELKIKLLTSNTSLSTCTSFNEDLLGEMEKSSDKLAQCENELGSVETEFSSSNENYDSEITRLGVELGDKTNEINDLKQKYDFLSLNIANNLCCKAKIDNPDIGYYKVENDMVVCLEEGELIITC